MRRDLKGCLLFCDDGAPLIYRGLGLLGRAEATTADNSPPGLAKNSLSASKVRQSGRGVVVLYTFLRCFSDVKEHRPTAQRKDSTIRPCFPGHLHAKERGRARAIGYIPGTIPRSPEGSVSLWQKKGRSNPSGLLPLNTDFLRRRGARRAIRVILIILLVLLSSSIH